jgi:AraC-like DNA-binding protein/tetratricopeptide (TPR) repeat protein
MPSDLISAFMDNKLSMDKQFVKRLTEVIEKNLSDDKFGVNELASELGMSRSTLHRKVKSVVKKKVSSFIREVRLERSYVLLQQKTGTVSEIAFQVGFGSAAYFNRCFHDHFGFSPGEVLKGYHHIPENKKTEEVTIKRRSKLLRNLTAIVFFAGILIAAYIVINYLKKTEQVKTIAVLPIEYNSLEENKISLVKGFNEDLENNFNSIENLKLANPTSDNNLAFDEFKINAGKNLNTDFILISSAEKSYNNSIKLTFQLFRSDSTKQFLLNSWSRRTSMEDYFEVLRETTITVVELLNVNLTPKEEDLFKVPKTKNTTAYSLYTHGRYAHKIFNLENNYDALKKAKILYQTSLDNDSNFVLPMEKLGWLLLDELQFIQGNENLDLALLWANKAIKIKPDFSEALVLKGAILQKEGKNMEAINALNQAIKYNPKEWKAYYYLSHSYALNGDMFKAIEICMKARQNNIGQFNSFMHLSVLQGAITYSGFFNEADFFRKEMLELYNDSLRYFRQMQIAELCKGDYSESIEYGLKILNKSEDLITLELLAKCSLILRDYNRAWKFYQQYAKLLKFNLGFFSTDHEISSMIGMYLSLIPIYYSKQYELNQETDIFNVLFDNELKLPPDSTGNQSITLGNIKEGNVEEILSNTNIGLYELISIYGRFSSRKITKESLVYLRKRKSYPIWLLNYFNVDPMVEGLRDGREFKDTYKIMEEKYSKEHRRIQKLLSKNNLPIN